MMNSTRQRRLRRRLKGPSVLPAVPCLLALAVVACVVLQGISPPSAAAQGTEAPPTVTSGADEDESAPLVEFVGENASWILGLLAVALVVVVGWAARGAGRPGARSPPPALVETPAPGERRYSSTKIELAEVNDRLGAKVTETQVETEREYALIVDEEALHSAAPREEVDPRTGNAYAKDAEIDRLIKESCYEEAYNAYLQHIDANGSLQFHREVEEVLGNHFLKAGDLDRASRVLEHHVATHDSQDVRADVYFNLGYIHFVKKRPNKSRRFLRLFLESSRNRQHIERAKRILQSIESAEAGR